MAALFNTLEFANRLGAGGFTTQQAQTDAAALSDTVKTDVATKADVEKARLELAAKIAELDAKGTETRLSLEAKISETRLSLEAKISDAKWQTVRWMIGIVGFQSLAMLGALFGLIKLVK